MTSANNLTIEQLRPRVLDFLTACDLLDGRGFDLVSDLAPELLRSLARDNAVALTRDLEEALSETAKVIEETSWFSEESADKARELVAPLAMTNV